MTNLMDYVAHERSTFNERPFGPLDAAVLSQACMVNAPDVIPAPETHAGMLSRARVLVTGTGYGARFSDLVDAHLGDKAFTGLVPQDIRTLISALATSPRYRDLRLRDMVTVEDDAVPVQFGAMTFTWRERFAFIGFRGTGAGFGGWRENLLMCTRDEVAAQALARRYLEDVAPHLPGHLEVGGHSKGGNLASYAALCSSQHVCSRIDHVWMLDAPGFRTERFATSDWDRLSGRVTRILPESSLVGVLLSCPIKPHVVHSSTSGIDAHSVFSWQIEGSTGYERFVEAEGLSDFSHGLHDIMEAWLAEMDDQKRLEVVNALSAAIGATGAHDITELLGSGADTFGRVAEAARRIDDHARQVLGDAMGNFARIAMRRAGQDVAATISSWIASQ